MTSLRLSTSVLAALGAACLAGCGPKAPVEPLPPVIQRVEVKVPVPVPCPALTKVGEAPGYADTNAALQAAADIYEQVRLLLTGRAQRSQRNAELEAARDACKG